MIYSLATTLLICFSLYAAFACVIVTIALLKEVPDVLSDALDTTVAAGARIVRPGASTAQIDHWSEMAFGYILAAVGIGALYLLGQGALLLFG